jgi:hypothetical protein
MLLNGTAADSKISSSEVARHVQQVARHVHHNHQLPYPILSTRLNQICLHATAYEVCVRKNKQHIHIGYTNTRHIIRHKWEDTKRILVKKKIVTRNLLGTEIPWNSLLMLAESIQVL